MKDFPQTPHLKALNTPISSTFYGFLFSAFLSALALGLLSCQRTGHNANDYCGGSANFACPKGYFCKLTENCGGLDRKGYCEAIPESCPLEERPVCSCNGNNFSSTCYANAARESVAYAGPCMKK